MPFFIRVPLVPGVTDTRANQLAIAAAVHGLPGLQGVDLLPYNCAAGAKYPAAGMPFHPDYNDDSPVNIDLSIYEDAGIKVRVA